MPKTPMSSKQNSLLHYFSPLTPEEAQTGAGPVSSTEPIADGSVNATSVVQPKKKVHFEPTPTKKIVLKIKVTDKDLEEGVGRRNDDDKTVDGVADASGDGNDEENTGNVQPATSSRKAVRKAKPIGQRQRKKRISTGNPVGRPRKHPLPVQQEVDTAPPLPPQPPAPVLDDFVFIDGSSFPLFKKRFANTDANTQDGIESGTDVQGHAKSVSTVKDAV